MFAQLIGIDDLAGRHCPVDYGLAEHIHAGAMEICYLVRGQQIFHVAGRDYMMRGNDLFITLPDERHSTGRNPLSKSLLYWMQVIPRTGRKFLLLGGDESRPLVRQLLNLPRRSFAGRKQLQRLFEKIFRESQAPSQPLRKLRVATLLLEFLQIVCDCSRDKTPHGYSYDIRRVIDAMAANIRQDMSVDAMAEIAGLSTPRFKIKFKQQVGIPPREYFMRAKTDAASKMLAGGKSVTAVAMDLGFSSSQYFATVFRRFTNRRPGSLRQ